MIDHILINRLFNENYTFSTDIQQDNENYSDHLAVSISFESKIETTTQTATATVVNTTDQRPNYMNWNAAEQCEYFNTILSQELFDKDINKYLRSDCIVQSEINQLYDLITSSIKTASTSTTIAFVNNKAKQPWWTSQLTRLKKEMNEIRQQATNRDSAEIKDKKKEFRRIQRQSIFLHEKLKCQKIDENLMMKNYKKFWSGVKLMNTKNDVQVNDTNAEVLNDHLQKFFFDKYLSWSKENEQFAESVNSGQNRIKKDFISSGYIKSLVGDMERTNSTGSDGTSMNMLKCGIDWLAVPISHLLESMINHNLIPNNFNTSIIVPIKKNLEKVSFDVNNFRPLSILNPISQIFEKIMLDKCSVIAKTAPQQFGFRKSISTIHPLYIVKETIQKHKQDHSPLYLVAFGC